jgi:DNA-binding beta-propeller fold protein YncE
MDSDGNVIVADKNNHCIRLITPQGQVSTMAGTGENGYRDREGTVAQFYSPNGVAVDGDGNVIVADSDNNRIHLITPQGHVFTLAGTGKEGYKDGEGTVAHFYFPMGVAVDGDGNVIVADVNNHRIRLITSRGHVSTLAGIGKCGYRDGHGTAAQFASPSGLAVDGASNVIVVDTGNSCIRLIARFPGPSVPYGGEN